MEWIACKNRLPEISDDYLIYTSESYMYVANWAKIWEKKNFWQWVVRCECSNAEDCLLNQDMITHWMPIPYPPIQ
jgi:uncharacterized protein DUF551